VKGVMFTYRCKVDREYSNACKGGLKVEITVESLKEKAFSRGLIAEFEDFLAGKTHFEITAKGLSDLDEYGFDMMYLFESGLVPKNDTLREDLIAHGTGYSVYLYAYYVDKEPRKDTRDAVIASKDGFAIAWYAGYVDKFPTDVTRNAVIASGDARAVVWYSEYVDRGPRDDTKKAIIESGDEEAMEWYIWYVEHSTESVGEWLAKYGNSGVSNN
jgi:hypothetical protein